MTRSAVAWLIDHACGLTRHAGGCWLLNGSPLRRVWWWSLELEVGQ